MKAASMPYPRLAARDFDSLPVLTDDALAETLGVRVAFSGRAGGASTGAYAQLNVSSRVGDVLQVVSENRMRLMRALGAPDLPLVVPNQVHGTSLVEVAASDAPAIERACAAADAGADGVVVSVPQVAALLCFADCVPVVIVSPTGRFAVVHAGWRGVAASIAPLALRMVAADAAEEDALASCNVYLGPCIHAECFETGPDVHARFVRAFGTACAPDEGHIDLVRALAIDLARSGADPQRIVDAGICTSCNSDRYFSYRAADGACGRHAAVAFWEGR